jgi:hypothetical protein
MPASANKNLPPARRLALYRKRAERAGMVRAEVSVPAKDITHIRTIARALREGGVWADKIRAQSAQIEKPRIAQTGAELVDFLRRGAKDGFALDLPERLIDERRETGF